MMIDNYGNMKGFNLQLIQCAGGARMRFWNQSLLFVSDCLINCCCRCTVTSFNSIHRWLCTLIVSSYCCCRSCCCCCCCCYCCELRHTHTHTNTHKWMDRCNVGGRRTPSDVRFDRSMICDTTVIWSYTFTPDLLAVNHATLYIRVVQVWSLTGHGARQLQEQPFIYLFVFLAASAICVERIIGVETQHEFVQLSLRIHFGGTEAMHVLQGRCSFLDPVEPSAFLTPRGCVVQNSNQSIN